MAEDRAESPKRQVTGAMNRDAHELLCPGSPEVMMAAADMHQHEASTFEGADHGVSAGPREPGHGIAISTSTSSAAVSAEIGIPSLLAASRYPRIASRV